MHVVSVWECKNYCVCFSSFRGYCGIVTTTISEGQYNVVLFCLKLLQRGFVSFVTMRFLIHRVCDSQSSLAPALCSK